MEFFFVFVLFTFWYVLWCFIVYKLTSPPDSTDLAYTFAQKTSGHSNRNTQFIKLTNLMIKIILFKLLNTIQFKEFANGGFYFSS